MDNLYLALDALGAMEYHASQIEHSQNVNSDLHLTWKVIQMSNGCGRIFNDLCNSTPCFMHPQDNTSQYVIEYVIERVRG